MAKKVDGYCIIVGSLCLTTILLLGYVLSVTGVLCSKSSRLSLEEIKDSIKNTGLTQRLGDVQYVNVEDYLNTLGKCD